MTDIPIIFSAPMIRALLDGRKTMTRRLAWRKETEVCEVSSEHQEDYELRGIDCREIGPSRWLVRHPSPWQRVKPGDRLWVRESLQCYQRATAQYVADITPVAAFDAVDRAIDGRAKWTWKQATLPSIHMPRWASRLTLIVTAKKIERLQNISYDDAIAEGCTADFAKYLAATEDEPSRFLETPDATARRLRWPQREFADLWTTLHGPDAWAANPEIVALTFTVHKTNIDAMPKAEAA